MASPGNRYQYRQGRTSTPSTLSKNTNAYEPREIPNVRNAYLGKPVDNESISQDPDSDHTENGDVTDVSSERKLSHQPDARQSSLSVCLTGRTLDAPNWLFDRKKRMEDKEKYAMCIERLDDDIFFKPLYSLAEWFHDNMDVYPESDWKTRIQTILDTEPLFHLLPSPARQERFAVPRSYHDSMIHMALILASAFGEYRGEYEVRCSSMILHPEVSKFFYIIAACGVFTENTEEGVFEVSTSFMGVEERRMISAVFGEYNKFAATRMSQMGKDIRCPETRADFHRQEGYYDFMFRGEVLPHKTWNLLGSYAKGKFKEYHTGLRHISYLIASQGLKFLNDAGGLIDNYDAPQIERMAYRQMRYPAET